VEDKSMTEASAAAIVVGRSAELPEGGRLVIEVDGFEVGIFRVEGRLYAWENRCAHQGGPVCQGMLIRRVIERLDDERQSLGDDYAASWNIVCPWHGYEFDVCTGKHRGAAASLTSVAVTEREGSIVLEL
jgi:nitrite reductase/ring-hydroxylating ferredoxin subunit